MFLSLLKTNQFDNDEIEGEKSKVLCELVHETVKNSPSDMQSKRESLFLSHFNDINAMKKMFCGIQHS